MRVQLPAESRHKLEFHEREFAEQFGGEVVYNPTEDWIEVPDTFTENDVLNAYTSFVHDDFYGRPEHHKRAVELLEKEELTTQEEKELRTLERKLLRERLR